MPTFPRTATTLDEIGGSVFSALAHRMERYEGEIYPLHVGDTWLEPADGCRMQDFTVERHPGMHRYAPPQGLPQLLEALASRLTTRTGVETTRNEVLVAAGATGALGAVMGALLEPNDEVIVLAPFWPLITGIVRCAHGTPVVVPTIGSITTTEALIETLERARTNRTAALYLSTPNNPTGAVMDESWLKAMVDWAVANDLWIVADEVYEDYVYEGKHVYARSLAPDRTFSAHSFSKAFGMAGNRCGYVAGPKEVMRKVAKVSTHTFYSTPTASQLAAVAALDGRGDAWVDQVRPQYRDAGRAAAQRLGLPAPAGSTFLFLDVADSLDGGELLPFLERCADRGLFLAPGPSFGPYPTHVRLCFTSASPDVIGRGVETLAGLLGH